MVHIPSNLLPIVASEVNLYYCLDPLLSNLPILVFHGASTTTNATHSSSRIQIHIVHPGGAQSYPRLTISPNSATYEVVDELPKEWQGDEACRGLAFGIMKYFGEMSDAVKTALIVQNVAANRGHKPMSEMPMFGKEHAASLASSLVKVENAEEIIKDLEAALQGQVISNVDVDLVLPPGTIKPFDSLLHDEGDDDDEEFDPLVQRFGQYAPLIGLFGETCFLPSSKMKRAPSRPASMNRSRSFMRDQKLSLRREMGEFVDTEERYVIKIHELVNNIAEDFRAKAKRRHLGSASPSEEDMKKLFPPSLDNILKANKGFLADIQKVMDDTEEEAMQDLEEDQPMFLSNRNSVLGQPKKDPTGAAAFAKVLLEWFPRFSECYQDYIRSSQDFPQLISHFVRQQSSFSSRVQQTGEQKLRSAIIEPVQRLPRYSLFIDNIVTYLPIAHPAIKSMLGARDIITAICSLDPADGDASQTVARLKSVVGKWPTAFMPQGRLITAADFVELPPPYHSPEDAIGSNSGVLLLFADTLVICKKNKDAAISARGVMAEVDRPSTASMMASVAVSAGGATKMPDLAFAESYNLQSVRFSESEDNRTVWMTNSVSIERGPSPGERRAFLLRGSHESKAYKWSEEVTKARIEGRFGEKERTSDKWELRSTVAKDANLSLYAAVFEEGVDTLITDRREPAPIRIVVDREKGTKGAPIGHYGVEIISNLTVTEAQGFLSYHIRSEGLFDRVYNDFADGETFLSVLAKRVSTLLQNQLQAKNPVLTSSFISFHKTVLNSLSIQVVRSEQPKAGLVRPASPVKLLSGFLSGASFLGGSTNDGSKSKRTPLLGNIPNFSPPSLSRSSSKKEVYTLSGRPLASQNSSFRMSVDESTQVNPIVRLEETFSCYVAALQERRGNIVGRVIRNRSTADELSVNAVYNSFIENPADTRAACQVSVDVLFCAFEKFLRMAWHDQMGPVTSVKVLEQLQQKSAKLFPGDFADFMKVIFADMAPQNKRAFVAIIKLLADLLDGCGNDGDRGALTAAFTEMLVEDADPHRYINLLDRLVEDSERLFEDYGAPYSSSNGETNSMYGSINSTMRSHAKSGSLTSNTSSFRKRWGFDSLLRTNSKKDLKDNDHEKSSVWRTLSKSTRSVATGDSISPGSLSRGVLHRSKSIDYGRNPSPVRPNSSSNPRAPVLGVFDEEAQRPNTSHSPSRIVALGGSPLRDDGETKRTKKSRRSSLSDLKSLMAEVAIEGDLADTPAPLSVQRPNQIPKPTFNSSPRTPSPTKPLAQRQSMYNNSPGNMFSNSPKMKENIGINGSVRGSNTGSLAERSNNLRGADIVTISDLWATQKPPIKPSSTLALSGIPLLRKNQANPRPLAPAAEFGKPGFHSTLAQRKAMSPPTHLPVPVSPEQTRQKLRLQSPKKLRERLQDEARAITDVESNLQSELSKIGEEMARLCGNSTNNSPIKPNYNSNMGDLRKLSESVKSLESRIPIVIKDLTMRNEATSKEMEKSLVAAETKVKGLDRLYRETAAENEILYERFNTELGKIVTALKGKSKSEGKEGERRDAQRGAQVELMDKYREALEQAAEGKKECMRLKREMVSLKTALRAAEMR